MPESKHLNYYGFLGFFVGLSILVSYFLIRSKDCVIAGDYENLQIIHITGVICGATIFVLSLFNIAGVLYDIKIIFFLAIIAIITIGGIMFWAAYIAFTEPCGEGIGGALKQVLSGKTNAFEAKDGHNIAVFVLDIIAGLSLLSIGFTFAKRL